VLAGETVAAIDRTPSDARVALGQGRTIDADCIAAGLGIEPNVELANSAGLPVEDGIVVDQYGSAGGRDDVFAAGDAARFPVPALGTRMRVEHEDHAKSHGRLVGANMTGSRERYEHLPFFYSDLFDFGYEAVGLIDARMQTVGRWIEPGKKGVVAYVDDAGQPRGFLLWGIFGCVDAARDLIRAGEAIGDDTLATLIG
jgi:NADPH-dependent 2,4-dienoyl-CoA reductase/sulfur reductase-like enzyme